MQIVGPPNPCVDPAFESIGSLSKFSVIDNDNLGWPHGLFLNQPIQDTVSTTPQDVCI